MLLKLQSHEKVTLVLFFRKMLVKIIVTDYLKKFLDDYLQHPLDKHTSAKKQASTTRQKSKVLYIKAFASFKMVS